MVGGPAYFMMVIVPFALQVPLKVLFAWWCVAFLWLCTHWPAAKWCLLFILLQFLSGRTTRCSAFYAQRGSLKVPVIGAMA